MIRTIVGPLLAYHILILVGALFVVAGIRQDNLSWEWVGVFLVIAGVATMIAVLWWAASLARRNWTALGPPSRELPEPNTTERRSVCGSCGWMGISRTPTCPRCRKPVVRML